MQTLENDLDQVSEELLSANNKLEEKDKRNVSILQPQNWLRLHRLLMMQNVCERY